LVQSEQVIPAPVEQMADHAATVPVGANPHTVWSHLDHLLGRDHENLCYHKPQIELQDLGVWVGHLAVEGFATAQTLVLSLGA